MFSVLNICFAIENLNKIVITVIRHHQLVLGELEIQFLALCSPDNPGAVQRNSMSLGMIFVLCRYVGTT